MAKKQDTDSRHPLQAAPSISDPTAHLDDHVAV
jgi:hypothetical protein